MRPKPTVLAAGLLTLIFLAIGGAAQLASYAQPPSHEVVVEELPVDPDGNGYVTLPVGTDDGLIAAICGGGSPQGGTGQIPNQVTATVGPGTTRLRVWNHIGQPVTVAVTISCTGDFLTQQAAQQGRQKLRSVRQGN